MTPLEGLSDYVDINAVVNPWQAIVVVVFIFALLIWPSMSARRSSKRIEKTLTQNNGGSSIKDQLDRLEKVQADQGAVLDGHISWSEGYVSDVGKRLEALEDKRPRWPWSR